MSKVITFSRVFPAYHPRAGQSTYFVEKFWNSFNVEYLDQDFYMDYNDEIKFNLNKAIPCVLISNFFFSLSNRGDIGKKMHTIRSGNRWKIGDKFSPRVWSGKPYNTKQIIIAPDIEIKKIWDFEIKKGLIFINDELYAYNTSTELLDKLANNDGLTQIDLLEWFQYPKDFKGQIICWNENINY